LYVDATAGEEPVVWQAELRKLRGQTLLDVDATAGKEPVILLAELRKLHGLRLPEVGSGYKPTLVISWM
jgi:hypothetical protein